MAKKIIGWILFVWGLGGLIAYIIVFIAYWHSAPITLIINSLFCFLFMWGGWSLAHSKQKEQYGDVDSNGNLEFDVRCPICKSDTTLRTAKKGKETGKQFYVCVKHPECPGRVQVRERAL